MASKDLLDLTLPEEQSHPFEPWICRIFPLEEVKDTRQGLVHREQENWQIEL